MALCATGGFSCEAWNTIISGLEKLPRCEVGVTPDGSTIGRTAKELEKHAAQEFNLSTQESTSQPGPSHCFSSQTLLRLLLKGFGLDGVAVGAVVVDIGWCSAH